MSAVGSLASFGQVGVAQVAAAVLGCAAVGALLVIDGPAALALAVGMLGLSLIVLAGPGWRGPALVITSALVVGAIVEYRVGASPRYLMLLLAVAGCGFAAAIGTVRRLGNRIEQLSDQTLVAVCGTAIAIRLAPLMFGRAALESGSLLHVQIGELTRLLLVAAYAVGAGRMRGPIRMWDRTQRWLVVLAVIGETELILVKDLGPALLCAAGMVAATPRVHALSRRGFAVLSTAGIVAAAAGLTGGIGAWRLHVMLHPDSNGQVSRALAGAAYGGLVGDLHSPYLPAIYAAGSDLLPDAAIALFGAVPIAVLAALLVLTCARLLTATDQVCPSLRLPICALVVMTGCAVVWSIAANLDLAPLSGISCPFLVLTGSSIVPSLAVFGVAVGATRAAGYPSTPPPLRAGPTLWPAAVVGCAVLVSSSLTPALASDVTAYFPRGQILTADGAVIATTRDGPRIYPYGTEYVEAGWFDPASGDSYGIESMQNQQLVCGTHLSEWAVSALLRPARCVGATIVTTLDARVQSAAVQALASRRGQAVVLDARTGDVLALYGSTDSYPASGQVLSSPARTNPVPIGSVFKIVTASAALVAGLPPDGAPLQTLELNGETLSNDEGFSCPAATIAVMLEYSCNTVAGYLALQLGTSQLASVARAYFGFDTPPVYRGQPGLYDGGTYAEAETGLTPGTAPASLARTGAGLEGVRATPLNLASIGAVLADAGHLAPGPRIVLGTCDGGHLHPITTAQSAIGSRPLPAAVGAAVLSGMRDAVAGGTATALASTGRDVAAKTGTADVADQAGRHTNETVVAVVDHRYVIAVVIELPTLGSSGAAVRAAAQIMTSLPTDLTTSGAKC